MNSSSKTGLLASPTKKLKVKYKVKQNKKKTIK